MPPRITDKMVAWVREYAAMQPPGAPLPVDSELAARWGVSQRSVASAMRRLAHEGVIERYRGKGSYVPRNPGNAAGEAARTAPESIDSLHDKILHEIRAGRLKAGEALPSVKYMARRLRLRPATVTDAYRRLIARGIVTRVGKTFWLGPFERLICPPGRRQVIFYARREGDLETVFRSSTFAPAYRKMEDALAVSGFTLRLDYLQNFESQCRRWIAAREFPYGLVFFDFGTNQLSSVSGALSKLFSFSEHRIPVIIDWYDYRPALVPRHTWLLNRGNLATTVARALARFVAERGHEHIAVFVDESMLHRVTLGRMRFVDFLRFRAELTHYAPNASCTFVIVSDRPKPPDEELFPPVWCETVSGHLSKYVPTDFTSIRDEIHYYTDKREAFGDHTTQSVWVFQLDSMAAAALQWARKSKVAVPGRLSIVSCDSGPVYCHHGLTRCEADWESIGYLMAHAIIGDFAVERTGRRFLRLRARTIEKLTT